MLAQSQQRAFWTQVIVQPFPLRAADCTKQDGIALFSQGQRLLWEWDTYRINSLSTDRTGQKLEPVLEFFGHSLQHFHSFRDDFSTHPITGEYGNLRLHSHPPSLSDMAIPVSTRVLPHPLAAKRDRPGRETR